MVLNQLYEQITLTFFWNTHSRIAIASYFRKKEKD